MRNLILTLLLSAMAAAPLDAQTATLVRDINTDGPVDSGLSSSSPSHLTAVGGKVFFTAFEPSLGSQVWVSDGTSAGTELLRVETFPEAREIQVLGSMRNLFWWSVETGSSGHALVRSDGTRAGTFEIFPGALGVNGYTDGDRSSAIAGDRLYFIGCTSSVCRLWTSDGTPAGTQPVPGSPSSVSGAHLVPVGNRVFFRSENLLWISDGSAAGTHAVKETLGDGVAAGNRLYFFSSAGGDKQLWTSDGTPAGTIPVTRFTTATAFSRTYLIPAGNSVFFSAQDAAGQELWTSDGTPAGTRRLTDFPEDLPFGNGLFSSYFATVNGRPLFLTYQGETHDYRLWTAVGGKAAALTTGPVYSGLYEGNGRVYFIGVDSVGGYEPWVSDGTAQGTHLLKNICRDDCGSNTSGFVTRAGVTYFSSQGDVWQTDGTEAGTKPLTSPPFTIDPSDSLSFEIVPAGGKLFVSSPTPYGRELWVHDQTGNHVVTDIARGAPDATPRELVSDGDRLFFTACDGTDRSLWQSPAAGNGATPVLATAKSCRIDHNDRWWLTAGGLIYFQRADDQQKTQLWRSDGTEAGTFQLTDLPKGVVAGDVLNPGPFQGKLLFATYGSSVEEIWESDGTVAGTRKSPYLPGDFTSVGNLRTVGDELYFFAVEGQNPGLWRSDGTAAGTRKIAPLFAGSGGDPQFVRFGGAVFFFASIPGSRRQLWRTDGTLPGTQAILNVDGGLGSSYPAELILFQGSLFVLTNDDSGNETLWRSDGTVAGTTPVKLFPNPLRERLLPHGLTSAGGKLFFSQTDNEHGTELWSTDGTPQGTALVKDIFPGPISSQPAWLTSAGDRLFFTALDREHGTELWESDGTAAGTRLVQDLAPEALSASPDQLTVAGDHLFFTADDGQSGRELWSLPLAGAGGCQASSAHLCLNGGRYQVEASWRDSQGNTGRGTAVPLSGDTGYFWFFSPGNVEAVVKVLDGTGTNGHVWVFYGALSNVEYTLTVTDTQTGLTRRYFNPQGQFASVGDVHGFGPLGAYGANPQPPVATAAASPLPLIAERQDKAATVPCQPTALRLCLNGNRFAVDVAWKDFQGHTGQGTAMPLSGDTGAFWFFGSANIELVVKALDGRPVNGHFWLFYGALSNVEYTLTVTDTQTGTIKTYRNPSGRFASVGDATAF